MPRGRQVRTLRRVYGWPLAIAAAMLSGLVSALVGDGPFDWLSWLTLSLPAGLTVWAVARVGRTPSRSGD